MAHDRDGQRRALNRVDILSIIDHIISASDAQAVTDISHLGGRGALRGTAQMTTTFCHITGSTFNITVTDANCSPPQRALPADDKIADGVAPPASELPGRK